MPDRHLPPEDAEDAPGGALINRRQFFQVTGLAACAVTLGGASVLAVDFLHPRVLYEPATRFSLGLPDALAVGSVTTDEKHHAFVVRQAAGFWALSSVCTHLGCIARYRPDEQIIACPCHGSRFALDGGVLHGPAPRPLHQLSMSLSETGELVVDTATEVPHGTVYRF
jgi:cytochrome b6-f complex iron-sulfur subunit